MKRMRSTKLMRFSVMVGITMLLIQSSIMMVCIDSAAQQPIINEYDFPIINPRLEGTEYSWKITRTMGIFATQNMHSGDMMKYRVRTANENDSHYVVDVFYDNWTTKDYVLRPEPENATMFLIPRNWSKFLTEEIIPDLVPHFCRHPKIIELYRKTFPGMFDESLTGQELLNEFNKDANFWEKNLGKDIMNFAEAVLNKSVSTEFEFTKFEYNTIWFRSRLITTMDISIELDENNYERLTYTRAEGILLARKTNILIINGTRKDYLGIAREFPFELSGNLDVEIIDFSREFEVSLWHYVIWVAIIMGIIFASIIVISVILRMRERRFVTMDY